MNEPNKEAGAGTDQPAQDQTHQDDAGEDQRSAPLATVDPDEEKALQALAIPPSPQAQQTIAKSFNLTSSPALAMWFDTDFFNRCRHMATILSKAKGFIPDHLINRPASCMMVISQSLTWKMDPSQVAMNTYETPGGRVGYFGKLCQAVLELSGRFESGIQFIHYGDWSIIQGKFEIRKSGKGKDYAVPTWGAVEASKSGAGVTVIGHVKGEREPRRLNFDLVQAFPRNSTLWATDPKTQICYTAVRRFASVVVPGIFMGLPFDREDEDQAEREMIDVTGSPAPAAALAALTKPKPASADASPPPPKQASGQPEAREPASEPAGRATTEGDAINYVALADIALAFVRRANSAQELNDWLASDPGVLRLKKEAPNLYTEILAEVNARGKNFPKKAQTK